MLLLLLLLLLQMMMMMYVCQCDRVIPCLVLSKPLPDWLEARVTDMATELDLRVKVIALSVFVLLCLLLLVSSGGSRTSSLGGQWGGHRFG